AAGVDEVEGDPRARPGDARQLEVALDRGLAVADGHAGDEELLRIRVVNADHRRGLDGGHEVLVDRERADGRRAVAAVARVVDDGATHLHLGEREVDVRVRASRRADDTGLRERRDAAAEAVELAAVGIGAPEGSQQDGVPLRAAGGQVALVEEEGAARAAAHVDRPDLPLAHARESARVWASSPPARRISRSRGVRRHRAVWRAPVRSLTTVTRPSATSEAPTASSVSVSPGPIAS